jgi:Na+/H+-dicarboxylate symporter
LLCRRLGWLHPIGRLFNNLLTMVVIPLVAAALFAGDAGLGDVRRRGRLGAAALAFFWSTTVVAIALGFGIAAAFLRLAPLPAAQRHALESAAAGVPADAAVSGSAPGVGDFIASLVPANPVRAAVDGSLLPLIVFVTIFAVATAALPEARRRVLTDMADVVTQALIRVVRWVLLLAPVGIFALVAPVVAQSGWSMVRTMLAFVAAVIVGCAVLVALVYVPAVALLARLRPRRFLTAALPSMAMGFSTTSSLATLPAMLEAAEDDLRMSRGVAGLVLPLGASLNRAGSALYQAAAVLFAARLYGIPFGPAQAAGAGAAVFLASLTVAAVPAGSVVSLAPALAHVGVPLSGLGLLMGLDRVPDMFRTMTNVTGHLAGGAVVARVQGEVLA